MADPKLLTHMYPTLLRVQPMSLRWVRLALVVLATCSSISGRAQAVFSPEDLQVDLAVMKPAYETLHPGLFRYNTPQTLQARFSDLGDTMNRPLTLAETYLAFSRFLAGLKCGHTYCNYWNQSAETKKELFDRSDKLPFAFRIIGGQIFVSQDASKDRSFPIGTEILSINGIASREILSRMILYVKADGSNDGKRLYDLQVFATGDYETFDIFFPMLFPPSGGLHEIRARTHGATGDFTIKLPGVSRLERRVAIRDRYAHGDQSAEDTWRFEILAPGIASMKLGTFVTRRVEGDWQKVLGGFFERIRAERIQHLIVDIRGNEGGEDRVRDYLLRRLVSTAIELPPRRELLKYEKVPAELDPYLETWDKSFRNREGRLEKVDDGFYTWKNARFAARTPAPVEGAYDGRIYLLIDPANSSSTFYLASALKGYPKATLIGQTTGGSRRGMNGGQMFFLRLPKTKLEMDIPLIGTYPVVEQPDEGIKPDVHVDPSLNDLIAGVDRELETARELARRN